MASRRRRRRGKSEADAGGRDLISELPSEVKERILECLPTRDAARIALLSTHWNDVWLRHGRLVFDKGFFKCVSKYAGEKGITVINIIHDILMLRAGSVKKFTLKVSRRKYDAEPKQLDPEPQQSDLDRWCRFLSRNGVQELNLFIDHKLPSCIFSCRTIKKLILGDFNFDLPIRRRCIFPSVTSLAFENVEFSDNVKGIVYSIPNLEELSFDFFKGITNFEINSPKLERFTILLSLFWTELDGSRWFMRYFKTIKTLCLSARMLPCKNAEIEKVTFPTAINLQVIELSEVSVSCGEELAFVLQLLQNSPNLCKLKISASDGLCSCDTKMSKRLLEDPNSCIIKQDLKTLNTFVIDAIAASECEMLFVKMMLSKSPALERAVIMEYLESDIPVEVNMLKEFLRFPRASPKAQIIYIDHDGSSELFDNY